MVDFNVLTGLRDTQYKPSIDKDGPDGYLIFEDIFDFTFVKSFFN